MYELTNVKKAQHIKLTLKATTKQKYQAKKNYVKGFHFSRNHHPARNQRPLVNSFKFYKDRSFIGFKIYKESS